LIFEWRIVLFRLGKSEHFLNKKKVGLCILGKVFFVLQGGQFEWEVRVPYTYKNWYHWSSPVIPDVLKSTNPRSWLEIRYELKVEPWASMGTWHGLLPNRTIFDSNDEICAAALPHSVYKWVYISCERRAENIKIICEKHLKETSHISQAMLIRQSRYLCHSNMTMVEGQCYGLEYTRENSSLLQKCKRNIDAVNILSLTRKSYFSKITLGITDISPSVNNFDRENCVRVRYDGLPLQYQKEWYVSKGKCNQSDYVLQTEIPIVNDLSCSPYQFKCLDGTCILNHHLCDGEIDCPYGSDEEDCSHVCGLSDFDCVHSCHISNCSCSSLYFQCLEVGCIPYSKWCDGRPDCIDHSDEVNCSKYETISMVTGTTRKVTRLDAENKIVTSNNMAMNIKCGHGSEEYYTISGLCLYDRDTEGNPLYCKNTRHLDFCRFHECPDRFKCDQSYCIPYHRVCDQKDDCPNGEDERGCDNLVCPGSLKCKLDNLCVHPRQVCDGEVQCPLSRDDESLCNLLACPTDCACVGLAIQCFSIRSTFSFSLQTRVVILTNSNISVRKIYSCLQQKIYLIYLDLSRNNIKVLQPLSFQHLKNLLHLSLCNNEITTLHYKLFSGLRQLKTLDIQGNPIQYIASRTFSDLSQIECLYLHNLSLTTIDHNDTR